MMHCIICPQPKQSQNSVSGELVISRIWAGCSPGLSKVSDLQLRLERRFSFPQRAS